VTRTTKAPSFDDILAVMSAASRGDRSARVALPDAPRPDDTATKIALTLNVLLDDLAPAVTDAKRAPAERGGVADREAAFADASLDLSASTGNRGRLLEEIACRLGKQLAELCTIRTVTDDGEWVVSSRAGYPPDAEVVALVHQGMLAARQRLGERVRAVLVSRQPPLVAKTDSIPERFDVASSLTIALGSGGKVLGVANLLRSSSDPAEVGLNPVQTGEGLLVSSVIRDITERKLAEEQRARLAAIVDCSGEAIIGKTLDGVVTSWNLGACRIFGYEAAEMVGQPLSLLIPEDRANEETAILDALAKGDGQRFDTVRRRKDGTLVDVSVTIAPLRDGAGRIVGISKVARDITERRLAEVALARAKEAAEAAARDLEAFSYSVAHDLRAPLRATNGFARLVVDRFADKLDADGKDWLEEILKNARKMDELIDALLALARVTRSELKLERVDLSAVVREAAARRRAAEPERIVELHVEDNLSAVIDVRLARALIENLIENAWKFTAKTPSPRIVFGKQDGPGGRAFFLGDNGAGFEMASVSRLFAPFQRLHTVSEFPGTGIGLATVQRIVRRHGGRVWAEGVPDAGATVYFTLPTQQLVTETGETQ